MSAVETSKLAGSAPTPGNQKPWWLKHWRPILGVLVGGGLGFAYYTFIGCTAEGGGCPLTSNPYVTTTWGAVVGGLFLGR